MVWRGLVDPPQGFLVRARLLRHLLRTAREQVAADDAKVADKLAHLRVGEDEREEGAEVADGLLAVAARAVALDGGHVARALPRAV